MSAQDEARELLAKLNLREELPGSFCHEIERTVATALEARDKRIAELKDHIEKDHQHAKQDAEAYATLKQRLAEVQKSLEWSGSERDSWLGSKDGKIKGEHWEVVESAAEKIKALEAQLARYRAALELIQSIGTQTYGIPKSNIDPDGKSWEELNPQAVIAKNALSNEGPGVKHD